MTQAETSRGRGKPRTYDEDRLVARIQSVEDLERVRQALVANGEGLTARGVVSWLSAKHAGDATGGGVARMSESRYRAALARLPEDPLGPPSRRRRLVARSQRGAADLVLVGTGAGAMALASSPALHAVVSALTHLPPIMPQRLREPAELELAA